MKSSKLSFKKRFALLSAIVFLNFLQAQTNQLNEGVIGHWKTASQADFSYSNWQAEWIWLPDASPSNIILARKNFVLEKKPQQAILKITASSKYKLFINGKSICQGPARSAAHHQSYDILEIQHILKLGKNNISIKVQHQNNKHAYHLKGRAGLLAQLDLDKNQTIITDSSWKVRIDPSWDQNSPVMNRFQMVVNDRVDFRNKIPDWNQLNFNDSSWEKAIPLLRNTGWPLPKKSEKATPLTEPWISLVPREIPYLIEQDKKAINLIEAKTQENPSTAPLLKNKIVLQGIVDTSIKKQLKNYSKKNSPITIPTTAINKTRILLFDLGQVINGMPKLNIKGSAGTEVHILAAPFIVNNTFTQKIVDSEYLDKIILSGQTDNWQSFYFKPTRYLAISVKGNTDPIALNYIGIHQIKYPFNDTGTIASPEAPWIENFWEASKKTIDVTTTDAFTDNYRERRQYAQTGYYAALGNYWTFGDTALQRRYLIQVAQEQFANGIMPAYAPLAKDDYMIILDSNCLWIQSLYNYLLYSGDYTTVRELLASAKKLMALLNSFTDSSGLINSPPYAYWLDHTLNDRTGANLTLNGHYLGALENFESLLEWLEDPAASLYKKRSKRLRNSIADGFWNPKKGLFVDALTNGKQSKSYSEHGNAIALAYKIANPDQAKIVSEKLLQDDKNDFVKRKNGMTMVSPAMSYFFFLGLAENGYTEESLKLFNQRFSKMLAPETNKTLWEEWWRDGTGRSGKFVGGRTRSDAQTESAFPPALFARYILGLNVSQPGIKEILITRPHTSLKHIKATLPTPQGELYIKWTFTKKNKLELKIPEAMHVKIDLEKLSQNTIYINKKTLKESDSNKKYISLSKGSYSLVF